MILDKTHKPWFGLSMLVLIVACVWFAWAQGASPHGVTGGSISGLLFGIIGTLMMIFAGLLSVRKALPARRLGSAQFWLRGHLWLGILSVPFILFHAGFSWGGPLETVLLLLFAVVVITGIYGIVLQQILPRLLTVQVPMETFVEQIPYLSQKNAIFADRLISQQCGLIAVMDDPLHATFKDVMNHWNAASDKTEREQWIDRVSTPLRPLFRDLAKHAKQHWGMRTEADFPKAIEAIYQIDPVQQNETETDPEKENTKSTAPPQMPRAHILKKFYLNSVRSFLGDTTRAQRSPLADEFESRRMFSHIRSVLPVQFHETLESLQDYCEQHRQFATQTRLHWWLHSWLFLHVPATIALFVLLIAHILMALRVVPFGL